MDTQCLVTAGAARAPCELSPTSGSCPTSRMMVNNVIDSEAAAQNVARANWSRRHARVCKQQGAHQAHGFGQVVLSNGGLRPWRFQKKSMPVCCQLCWQWLLPMQQRGTRAPMRAPECTQRAGARFIPFRWRAAAIKTLWPSGLRRWLKAPVRKGVGSNPTGVIVDVGGDAQHSAPPGGSQFRSQILAPNASNVSFSCWMGRRPASARTRASKQEAGEITGTLARRCRIPPA